MKSQSDRSLLTRAISLLLCFSLSFGQVLLQCRTSFADDSDGSSVRDARDSSRDSEGTRNSAGDEGQIITSPETLISKGFLIELMCNQDSKLNGDFRVSMDGEVRLPYDVSIQAAGLRLRSLNERIVTAYRRYFRGTPPVRAVVKQKRFAVEVQGMVKSPGVYFVKERASLDEILAMAEVRTEDLPQGFARIEQNGVWRWVSLEDYFKRGSTHEGPAWKGGERILFQTDRPEGELSGGDESSGQAKGPSARKVQVIGEVKNPGGVSFQTHADAYYYLIERGGPTQNSDLSKVELLRTENGNEHTRISLGNISDIKDVQESDVLLVHPERPTPLERGLQNTALVATIITTIVLTIFVVQNK